ncbi:MAG: SGNH/GDSL hydrolase family protein [bacterium]|nr:SGNH/GDSL hydrolase family protein [bacterium]
MRVFVIGTVLTVSLVLCAHAAPSENELRLLLPETVYAVPGIETNIYFDNVVLAVNPANYVFDVTCGQGIQQNERWTFTPSPGDVGVHAFRLDVLDSTNRVVASAESRIVVTPADAVAGQPVSALLIGDSLTHASHYPARLLDISGGEGTPALTLIGSHAPRTDTPEIRHEGYGGWTAKRFATMYKDIARTGNSKERGSPFLYKDEAGTPCLDFDQYCADVSEGKKPEFITIFLGCNDTFSATDDTIEERIDDMLTHMDALLAMIHAASPDTRIGLIAAVPPTATQDAFGANYRCGQTRWQYRRNQHRVVERMHETYSGRDADNITLIPAYVNLDCVNNYPVTSAPSNAHATTTSTRQNNGVHPAEQGYRQIGDSIYCWMLAGMAETE